MKGIITQEQVTETNQLFTEMKSAVWKEFEVLVNRLSDIINTTK